MAWKRFWDRVRRRRGQQRQEPGGGELLAPLRKLAQDQGRSVDDVTYELLAHSLTRQVPASRPQRCWSILSPREQDVAALVYSGYSNPQIAYLLGLGVETVRSHVHRILRKCGVRSRIELCAALQWEGAEGRIQRRLEELLNPPPAPGERG